MFVGFYRWHLLDPIMFRDELTVTIQQIGAAMFGAGDDAIRRAYEADHPGEDLPAFRFAFEVTKREEP
jgi:hypothetical protein